MISRLPRWLGGSRHPARAVVLGLLLLATAGCSRAFYRRRADRDVYALIERASDDPRWPLEEFTIQPDPRSRMSDLYRPDFPPMPPDDPVSHELMYCVDGKRRCPNSKRYGETRQVESSQWKAYLPYNEEGEVVLDREQAVELALLHSRAYQTQLEELYLSALGVTLQRFQFDTQFFGGDTDHATAFAVSGPLSGSAGADSQLLTATTPRMERLFASGGQLMVEVANSVLWQFAGPDGYHAQVPLSFSFTQPLLRAAGRAVVLESLTGAERALLANIRQLERFRRGFYAQIVAGGAALPGPSRDGLGLGAVSTGTIQSAGGFWGLLRQEVEIRNQRSNVARLRESLERMEAFYEVGRISSQQVGITRQGLYDAQSGLLRITAEYETRLDGYKMTLGLPPDLDVKIEDPLLAPFDLIDPQLTATQDTVSELMNRLREGMDRLGDPAGQAEGGEEEKYAEALTAVRKEAVAVLEMVDRDLNKVNDALPQRRKSLQQLSAREEFKRGDIDPSVISIEALERRLTALEKSLNQPPEDSPEEPSLADRVKTTLASLEQFEQALRQLRDSGGTVTAPLLQNLLDWVDRLSGELLDLSLIQAEARLDTVTLQPIEIESQEALEIARANRRDWMNARAALVDTWRQVELKANDLKSRLDLQFGGNLTTTSNTLQRSHNTTGNLQLGLEFDTPLTRRAERNEYREALIAYQRARREYYAIEDDMNEQFRNMIRTIRLNQLGFEVQRASVFVAAARVDVAQERLEEPGGSELAVNTARDLVDALESLLNAQNRFLGIWVNQEALRLQLDLDVGTMQLDSRGMWIDPKSTGAEQTPEDDPAEKAPFPGEPLEEIPPPIGEPLGQAGG